MVDNSAGITQWWLPWLNLFRGLYGLVASASERLGLWSFRQAARKPDSQLVTGALVLGPLARSASKSASEASQPTNQASEGASRRPGGRASSSV